MVNLCAIFAIRFLTVKGSNSLSCHACGNRESYGNPDFGRNRGLLVVVGYVCNFIFLVILMQECRLFIG